MNRTVLLTGGAGFIGGTLARQWLQADSSLRIINLDALTYAADIETIESTVDPRRYVFVHGDINDRLLVHRLLTDHRPNSIVHLAAESHVDRSIDGPLPFLQTNVVGTVTLLETTLHYWKNLHDDGRRAFRFLHVSSDEVYGTLGAHGAFTEQTPYAPNSPYSASKAAADHFVRAYFHTYGLPTLITHCSNNYGPYQFPEKLIPLMILNALEGKNLPVYGDGQNIRDWLHVEDHCRALRTVLERGIPGEVYNIGGDCERTNLQIVHAICERIDQVCPHLPHSPSSQLIQFVRDRPGHDRRYAIDASKIQRELGWKPVQSFESGLAQTVAWYLANRTWVERITSGVYQRERLGLNAAS